MLSLFNRDWLLLNLLSLLDIRDRIHIVCKINFMVSYGDRYISKEEMEQAIREYGMNDGRDIKEIISEIDTDNVSNQTKIKDSKLLKVAISLRKLVTLSFVCRMVVSTMMSL